MNHSNHQPLHHNIAGSRLTNTSSSNNRLVATHHEHHGHHNHVARSETAGHHHMRMWFHGGTTETILFEWWQIESSWGLLFSCFMVFLMGVIYESVKWLRVYLNNVQIVKERQAANCPKLALSDVRHQADEALLNKSENSTVDTGTLRSDEVYKSTVTRENNRTKQCLFEKLLRRLDILSSSPFSWFRIFQTILYVVQIMLAYWLMLIAMTYNTYLTVAVVLGCGLGHFIFAVSKLTCVTSFWSTSREQEDSLLCMWQHSDFL